MKLRQSLAGALSSLLVAAVSAAVVHAAPAASPAPIDVHRLLPANGGATTEATTGGGTDGAVNVIVYGPAGLSSLDLLDRIWPAGPDKDRYLDINSSCQNTTQDAIRTYYPDGNTPLHETAYIWATDPGAQCKTSNLQGQQQSEAIYIAASVMYSDNGTIKEGGHTYQCPRSSDCVLPNDTSTGPSGFEYGRDGLPSNIGLQDIDSSGNATNITATNDRFIGAVQSIENYINNPKTNWKASTPVKVTTTNVSLSWTNSDQQNAQGSTAVYRNQYVDVICANPKTGGYSYFCQGSGAPGSNTSTTTTNTTTTNPNTGQTQAGISNFHALWSGDNVPSGNTFNVSPGQDQPIGPIDVTFQNDDSQGLAWNKSIVLMFAGMQTYTGQVNISPDQENAQPDPGLCDDPVGSNATAPNGTATGTTPGGKDWWSCSPLPIAAWDGMSDGIPAGSSFTFEFHAKVPSTFKHGDKWTVIFRPAEDDGGNNFKWIDTDQQNGDANKAALGGVTYEYFNIFVN